MAFSKEPALWIGLIGSIVLAVAQAVAGSGVISANAGQTLLNVVGTLVPLIVGIVTRFFVSPATTPGA